MEEEILRSQGEQNRILQSQRRKEGLWRDPPQRGEGSEGEEGV